MRISFLAIAQGALRRAQSHTADAFEVGRFAIAQPVQSAIVSSSQAQFLTVLS